MTVRAPSLRLCNLNALPLSKVVAHEGKGEIRFCRIASRHPTGQPESGLMRSDACNYVDYSVMPSGTSVGEHTHSNGEEEYYLILRGRGRLLCNGECIDVGPGDLIRNPPGGTHALENTGSEDLAMFVFEVEVPR